MFENAKLLIKENKMIEDGDIIGVATSGGKDSMALLCFLKELSETLDFEVIAIHVDHCIREESHEDAEFVLSFVRNMESEHTNSRWMQPKFHAKNL